MTDASVPVPPPADDPAATLQVATTQSIPLREVATRREHDLLGESDVPAEAYWGVHTKRAVENFPITGVPVGHFPDFVRALALVKQAAARANRRLHLLDDDKARHIDEACRLIAEEGRFHDQFVVDAVQGGAGTSTNMNANEVIANVALGLMGKGRGDYAALHPNDDVNMAQSTNDAYPTALRLGIILATAPLVRALGDLSFAFRTKAVDFADIVKMGRTQFRSDRISCRSTLTNQVRLVLHTAAYWLMLDIRHAIPEGRDLARVEFATLRLRLLKVAARVVETRHRVRIAFAAGLSRGRPHPGLSAALMTRRI